jgi:plastocyanin
MKTAIRAATVLTVLAGLWLAGAAGVRAADPDLIGGQLSATPSAVTLTSQSTVAVRVEMATDGAFTLTPAAFTIDPGETVTMAVTGDPSGTVSASMFVLETVGAGETSSVTLEVGFPAPAAPGSPIPLLLAALAALVATYAAIRWLRRHLQIQLRVGRRPA